MQNQENLVSIVIPAYNAAIFIEETIRSIFNQTYRNWEMIIINDGSTDKTELIIEKYSTQRIKLRSFMHRRGKVNVLNDIIPNIHRLLKPLF